MMAGRESTGELTALYSPVKCEREEEQILQPLVHGRDT